MNEYRFPWEDLTGKAGLSFCAALPFSLDEDVVKKEIKGLYENIESIPHHKDHYHSGGWHGLGLLAPDGNEKDIRLRPGMKIRESQAMKLIPSIKALIDQVPGEKCLVRLMGLAPNHSIKWHSDVQGSMTSDVVRLMMPVSSYADCPVQICHEKLVLEIGKIYFFDSTFPHRAINKGTTTRQNLVIDVYNNDELAKLFPSWATERVEERMKVKAEVDVITAAWERECNFSSTDVAP